MRIAIHALVTLAAASLTALAATPAAQQAAAPSAAPAFEVASIKPNRSGSPRAVGLTLMPGGRVLAQNVPLHDLIRSAYALEESQLEGGPGWITSERFDLEARTSPDATADQARASTRALLAERFGFAGHTEVRQLPVYELRMAKADRSLGPGLRPSGPECRPATMPAGLPAAPPPPTGAGMPLGTGGLICPGGFLLGRLSIRSVDMPAFASALWRRIVRRPVLDRTGLDGRFDVDLTYWSEFERVNGAPAPETGAPSIFTAVQEQLGLRLESTRGPVDVLVIDRVERPTEN
jgi:uncharacterized protein (TIGR03435 family)